MIEQMGSDTMRKFVQELRDKFPSFKISYSSMKKNRSMVDIRTNGRLFVWIYDPKLGYGVDEVKDGEGFESGYKYVYQTFLASRNRLIEMVATSASRSG
jgi:hypothetical protein